MNSPSGMRQGSLHRPRGHRVLLRVQVAHFSNCGSCRFLLNPFIIPHRSRLVTVSRRRGNRRTPLGSGPPQTICELLARVRPHSGLDEKGVRVYGSLELFLKPHKRRREDWERVPSETQRNGINPPEMVHQVRYPVKYLVTVPSSR